MLVGDEVTPVRLKLTDFKALRALFTKINELEAVVV
jgi:hypothetical protein